MRRWIWMIAAVAALAPAAGAAQQRRVEQLYTGDGRRLDYPPNGVWRVRARQVAAQRARLLAAGQFDALNSALLGAAPGAPAAATALSGILKVPTVLIAFTNTDTTARPKAVMYDSIYNTSVPLTGRPYTVRTYYEEVSNGLFSVQGTVYGWVRADTTSIYYYGACGGSGGSALSCQQGLNRLYALLTSELAKTDATVDFTQFDADKDGYVDDVRFVQPVNGAECGGPGYNAHHFSLSALGGAYVTNDPDPNHPGQNIKIDSYHMVPGVGGPSCNDTTQIAAIGTAAHELGHGLGLPDLYDVTFATEGIGEFGIMGSGNYTSLSSPAHQDAWSKQQLGWVTVTPITTGGAYTIDPVESSHQVYYVRVQDPNPRGEYFLIENKQPLGSDTANMNGARPKHGGLLLWHIDSTQVVNHTVYLDNATNVGPIHGVELTQADGLHQLDGQNVPNRGDAGDPYPGTTANPVLGDVSTPPSRKNSDSTYAGVTIDSITQVVPGGQMSFHVVLGGYAVSVAANRPPGVMGHPYSDTLRTVGGSGTTSWSLVSAPAALAGLTLASTGVVSGYPNATGTIVYTARASDGVDSVEQTFSIKVTAPILSRTAVVSQLLNGDGSLSVDDQRYLDYLGNNNGQYDVGDFLAWVKLTGTTPAPPRAAAVRGGRP